MSYISPITRAINPYFKGRIALTAPSLGWKTISIRELWRCPNCEVDLEPLSYVEAAFAKNNNLQTALA